MNEIEFIPPKIHGMWIAADEQMKRTEINGLDMRYEWKQYTFIHEYVSCIPFIH